MCNYLSIYLDVTEVTSDNNHLSPWWTKVRKRCLQATKVTAVFCAALVGRALAHQMISSSTKLDKDKLDKVGFDFAILIKGPAGHRGHVFKLCYKPVGHVKKCIHI